MPLEKQNPEHEQTETRAWPLRSEGARMELVVMSERAGAVYLLPRSGEIVLGRTSSSDICIDDMRVSRKHAVLRVGANSVEVIDLGSANGTQLGGQLISPHQPAIVEPGEKLVFGSTVALLRLTSGSEASGVRRVWTHAHFEASLEDACMRAATRKSEFAVMRVRFANPSASLAIESRLDSWMRPKDIVAAYSPHEWEFLLPDINAADVGAFVGRARLEFKELGVPFEVGVATYPASGRTREQLIAAAGPFKPSNETPQVRTQVGFLGRMRSTIERVASGTISILITGETGTGKEVLAQVIHQSSPRANAPLVCLNCAAFSETLLESELFGHERGAFTGATQSKPGLLESADGGTVFLDEVGEMPPSLQAKLLRVIEERKTQRVGGLKPRAIDVRFVSATNRDLEAEVARGTFRQDLYYRLNGVVLTVPALRERRDEIEPLASAFIAQSAAQLRCSPPKLSREVLELLQSYVWPGNIRELRNVIERAMLLCTGDVITLEHVPCERMMKSLPSQTVKVTRPPTATLTDVPAPPESASGVTLDRDRIVATLEACAGNQTQAAKLLGISRNTLIARMNAYDLARPRKRRDELRSSADASSSATDSADRHGLNHRVGQGESDRD